MICTTPFGQFGGVSALDVTPAQIAFVSTSNGLAAANFETAVVIRQIKSDINEAMGLVRLPLAGELENAPDSFGREIIDKDFVAALQEVVAGAARSSEIVVREQGAVLAPLVPNANTVGLNLISIFNVTTILAQQFEPIPAPGLPARIEIRTGVPFAGFAFLGLAALGVGVYFLLRR